MSFTNRILFCLLPLHLCLCLSACGGEKTNPQAPEETSDTDECLLADKPEIGACGYNGRGEQDTYCRDAEWITRCNDPDRCRTGNVERGGGVCASGIEETGSICEDGQWKPTCLPLEQGCQEGETRQFPNRCGDRGEYTQQWLCEEGTWQPGACGDTQQAVNCGTHTHNGDLIIGRDPRTGQYSNTAPDAAMGITRIRGHLVITNVGLNNLASFSSLRCVDGEIYIEYADGITTLENLSNLQSANTIFLNQLSELQSIQGLNQLKSLQKLVIIHSGQQTLQLAPMRLVNDLAHLELTGNIEVGPPSNIPFSLHSLANLHLYVSLDNLAGLEHFRHLNYLTLFIQENTNVDGLQNLETVFEFVLFGLQILGSFENPTPFAFPSLNSVQHLVIRDANRPISFPNLQEVAGELFIESYPFGDLPMMDNLASVGQELSLFSTGAQNLNALENLNAVGSITIEGNHQLQDVETLLGLDTITRNDAHFSYRNNGDIDTCQLSRLKEHLQSIGISNPYFDRPLPGSENCP